MTTRLKMRDAEGLSLEALVKRIEKLETLIGLRTSNSTSDGTPLSKGGAEARAMRDRVQSINEQNAKFWKESA